MHEVLLYAIDAEADREATGKYFTTVRPIPLLMREVPLYSPLEGTTPP